MEPHIRCSRVDGKFYKHDSDCTDSGRIFTDEEKDSEIESLRRRIEGRVADLESEKAALIETNRELREFAVGKTFHRTE